MAETCTIPCDARRLSLSLQGRLFGDETYAQLPVLGIAALALVAAPFVLLVAPAITAIVLVGWSLVGGAMVLGQAWLGASAPARAGMQPELLRLIEANATRIHPSRLEGLRDRAESLRPGHPSYDIGVTRILQDLREATGEAWRCPCAKRRLPLPLPF